MPTDPQQQLDALRRGLCGDCGVGPFKGNRQGAKVSRRTAAWIGLALLLLAGTGVGLAAWLGSG